MVIAFGCLGILIDFRYGNSILETFNKTVSNTRYSRSIIAGSKVSFFPHSQLTYTFTSAGTYYLGVSSYGNRNFNPVSGQNDTNGETGNYSLTISGLTVNDDNDDTISAQDTTVTNGGKVYVSSGGTALDVIINTGTIYVSSGGNWGNDTVEQLADGKVTLWFENGSESNWNAATLTYTDGSNSVTVTGVSNVTLKFGADASLPDGAFADAVSEKICEDKNKGMLA